MKTSREIKDKIKQLEMFILDESTVYNRRHGYVSWRAALSWVLDDKNILKERVKVVKNGTA